MSNHGIFGYALVNNDWVQPADTVQKSENFYHNDASSVSATVKLYDVSVARRRQTLYDRTVSISSPYDEECQRAILKATNDAYNHIASAITSKKGGILIPQTSLDADKRRKYVSPDNQVEVPACALLKKTKKAKVYVSVLSEFGLDEGAGHGYDAEEQATTCATSYTDFMDLLGYKDGDANTDTLATYVGAAPSTVVMPFLTDSKHITSQYNHLKSLVSWMMQARTQQTHTWCVITFDLATSLFVFTWLTSINNRMYGDVKRADWKYDHIQRTVKIGNFTYDLTRFETTVTLTSEYIIGDGAQTVVIPGMMDAHKREQNNLYIHECVERESVGYHPRFINNIVYCYYYRGRRRADTDTTIITTPPGSKYIYNRRTDMKTDMLRVRQSVLPGRTQQAITDRSCVYRVTEHLHTFLPPHSQRLHVSASASASAEDTIREGGHRFNYSPRLSESENTENMASNDDVRSLTMCSSANDTDLQYTLGQVAGVDKDTFGTNTSVVVITHIAFRYDTKAKTYIAVPYKREKTYFVPNVVHSCGMPAALTAYRHNRLPRKLFDYVDKSCSDMAQLYSERGTSSDNIAQANTAVEMFTFVPYDPIRYNQTFDAVESHPVIDIDTNYTCMNDDTIAEAASLTLSLGSFPSQTGTAVQRNEETSKPPKRATTEHFLISETYQRIKVQTDTMWYSSGEWRLGFCLSCTGNEPDKDVAIHRKNKKEHHIRRKNVINDIRNVIIDRFTVEILNADLSANVESMPATCARTISLHIYDYDGELRAASRDKLGIHARHSQQDTEEHIEVMLQRELMKFESCTTERFAQVAIEYGKSFISSIIVDDATNVNENAKDVARIYRTIFSLCGNEDAPFF